MNLNDKYKDIIGLRVGESIGKIRKKIRVVEEDGFPVTVSAEYRSDRVNVAIKNRKIIGIINEG